MAKTPDIVAVIIGRNDGYFLPLCLSSLQGFVDRVVYADTGSCDNSIQVAEFFGAQVLKHRWENFAANRNRALREGCRPGDIVLYIDCDEELFFVPPLKPQAVAKAVKEFFKSNPDGLIFLDVHNYNRGNRDLITGAVRDSYSTIARIFRYKGCDAFKGEVHNTLDLKLYRGEWVNDKRFGIVHHGYDQGPMERWAKIEKRMAYYRKKFEEEPWPKTAYEIVMALMYRGDVRQAVREGIKYIKEVLPKTPRDWPMYLYLVRLVVSGLVSLGWLRLAYRLAREFYEAEPDFYDLLYYVAHLGLDGYGEPPSPEAVYELLQAVRGKRKRIEPIVMVGVDRDIEVWLLYIKALSAAVRNREALREMILLIRAHREVVDVRMYSYLVSLLYANGFHRMAIRYLERYIAGDVRYRRDYYIAQWLLNEKNRAGGYYLAKAGEYRSAVLRVKDDQTADLLWRFIGHGERQRVLR